MKELARKPYSSHPDDSSLSIVLRIHQITRVNREVDEFVTHMCDTRRDGSQSFFWGHYFNSLEEALTDFNERGGK